MKKNKFVLLVFLFVQTSGLIMAQNRQYRKLSIEEMFGLADKNSRSIRTFDMAVQEAGQAVKVAKNAQLPSLDVSLSASYLGDGWLADRNFSDGENAPMPHFGNNFALEASQVVYAGGAISHSIALAELQHQLAQLDKEKNKQDIRFLLVGNYLELYQLHNQAEVYKKNIEQTRRLLEDIKAKQQEGLAIKNDITRYELQLKSLELALIQIENSQKIINNQLVTTLGLPQETLIEADTGIIRELPFLSPESQWQTTANTSSPILKQAQLGIQQAEQQEKIAKAEQLPSVALFASEHLDGPITIEVPPIDKNFNYWYIGIGEKFNIASVYKSSKKVRLAKLSTQKSIENEQLLQDNIQTAVKAAHIRFAESFTTYDTRLKSLELADQNYEMIRYRYLNDLALITDMLDASNSKLNAELQVANARIDILYHYYQLKKAAGIL